MGYAKSFLGKELYEISYADVEYFFKDVKEESDKIEFKSFYSNDEKHFNHKESGIIRAICGMLNSDGGLIIWGAPMGKSISGRKEKIYEGSLSPLEISIEKDAFISKISNVISPSPKGIKFQRLEKNGKYVYLVEIPQSEYAPHQYNNVYWMRLDGQTRAAPHHYIEALFKKITYPNLQGKLILDSVTTSESSYVQAKIKIEIANKSLFQNEHDIFIKLIAENSFIVSNDFGKPVKDKGDKQGSEMIVEQAKSILYHLSPLRNYFSILLMKEKDENKKFSFILIFGGKASPLKMSKYILKTGNELLKETTLQTEIENMYLHELNY
ncbi:MAG TPA: ATP-binding protein [Chitinophagales bacterium]|nr:ATP-binding protein [Chitinophagales bacterium]HNL84948.1 ATP-binding protein [Chitinophagales bacterium]